MATSIRKDFVGKSGKKRQRSRFWEIFGTLFISSILAGAFAFIAWEVGKITNLSRPAHLVLAAAVFTAVFCLVMRSQLKPPEQGIKFTETRRKAQNIRGQ